MLFSHNQLFLPSNLYPDFHRNHGHIDISKTFHSIFSYTQADFNTLQEGDYTIMVTSAENDFNNEIAAVTLGTIKIVPIKNAACKTTGLGKNIYTKTGLKRNARYYVEVRYFYYDSTNQKVYGAYSKSKSVKVYQI